MKQYQIGRRQRTAETLIGLETEFRSYNEVLQLLDPGSKLYDRELRPAVQKSLAQVPHTDPSDERRKLLPQLDGFLRFIMLLGTLENYDLLDREALNSMYRYWFYAVKENDHLMQYVEKYFPSLRKLLDERGAVHEGRQPSSTRLRP